MMPSTFCDELLAAREIRFFEEHVNADEIHGAAGFAIVEKHCDNLALQV